MRHRNSIKPIPEGAGPQNMADNIVAYKLGGDVLEVLR